MSSRTSTPAAIRRPVFLSAISVAAILAAICIGSAVTAPVAAQERPFWEQSDTYGDQRRSGQTARTPRRNDAFSPEPTHGPPGGFGQQAPPPGPSYESQGPYGSGPGSQPYGQPPYGAPDYGAAPRQADAYRGGGVQAQPRWNQPYEGAPDQRQGGYADADRSDAYRPPAGGRGWGGNQPPAYSTPSPGYGQPYVPPPDNYGPPPGAPDYGRGGYAQDGRPGYGEPAPYDDRRGGGTYSKNEVVDAGHRFFGSISQGLANAIEHVFKSQGRPNGYILGEDAGGAFVAGLRYGEGVMHTKDAGSHRVFWQGPSLGYDFGGEGSKTMVLVYNLRDPSDIYTRFGGVQGSAYVIGGVGVQFQKQEHVTLAVIRSGVGLRLGANVGYLKYTRTPTWNPF